MTEVGRAERLVLLVQKLAVRTPEFFEKKGPGKGDRASNKFMADLREVAEDTFGRDFSEFRVNSNTKLAIDFFFPEEETAVELAFGLHNSQSEFERDIFKCLLAREEGHSVKKLIFIGKPGALVRQGAPGERAIVGYAREKLDLEIQVFELQRQ